MSMVYTRPYKVANWIVVEGVKGKKRLEAVLEVLKKAGAKTVDWPGQTFKDHLLTFRKKGYAHHLPDEYPYNIDTSLLLRAAADHIKVAVSPTSYLGGAFSVPAHYINRKVTGEQDFENLFNEIIALEDDLGLSQIFRLGEDCNSGRSTDVRAFVSVGPVPKKLLTRMAGRVITVGDETNNDIVVGGLKEESQIQEAVNKFFTGE